MKKDRNCGGMTPMYNMAGQFPVMPLMPVPNPMPYQSQAMPFQNMNYQTSSDNQADILTRISNFEKRLSTLEGIINSNNSYNTSNYQMM